MSNYNLIGSEIAHKYKVIPIEKVGAKLILGTYEGSLAYDSLNDLNLLTGFKIELKKLDKAELLKLISKFYLVNNNDNNSSFLFSRNTFDLVEEAKKLRASDIHIEAYENERRIRFRIDGSLIERHTLKKEEFNELINKIKIESKIDITEKRLPQDGRIKNNNIDVRVNVLPTIHGEKIVLRLLGGDATKLKLEELGFSDLELKIFRENIKKRNGIILISGPTGSGKTTTLYAALNELNDINKNIVTIEDPVEYTLRGINQVQLKENIGLTFESALRSFLRQDPDIIMLGEIRDSKTASMAIRASLTGHIVLSTIHTNSATGIISRLIDMGIPSFLIGDTLNLVMAQRLIRKLCNHCKEPISSDKITLIREFTNLSVDCSKAFSPKGCVKCNYTGHTGRIGIYDLIEVDRTLKEKIKAGKVENPKNMSSLTINAINLFESGVTSFQEIHNLL